MVKKKKKLHKKKKKKKKPNALEMYSVSFDYFSDGKTYKLIGNFRSRESAQLEVRLMHFEIYSDFFRSY